jgi:competence protein ComEA
MRNRRSSPEHAEAVSRRLATLSAELATVRGDPAPRDDPREPGDGPGEPGGPGGPGDGGDGGDRGDPVPPAAPVPLPGRHARRRVATPRWAHRFPLGPAHLAVLALALALGLALTAWLVVRDSAEPTALPQVERAGAPLSTGPTTPAGGTSAEPPAAGGAGGEGPGSPGGPSAGSEITVDVAGKVRRPGIAVLPAGSRVVDAIEAAGGPRRGVQLTALNLARLLVDGEQVLVGVAPPAALPTGAAPGAPPTGATDPSGPAALVDLNTADQATLETLPGVGPVTALAILEWRDEHGGFTSVEELLEVDGIGEATLEDLTPHVTI